ncbi:hypothetical protein HPB50_018956 [Hyalomma asiaticum]|uniref:Uncharacterized protein n=1 Tax=Hyalomma asiaticum TaxID=266040 RepID=A0ACB7RPE6_HYAAI|nr:hypothetical protein HPB50_018956 [Hyalomma asiaticum]
MTPTGECLLAFNAVSEAAEFWKTLAAMDRWAKYSELISHEEKLQLRADLKDYIRSAQSQALQNWRYKMFIVKASKSPL